MDTSPDGRAPGGPLRPGRGGVVLAVQVQPGARREGLDGLRGGRLKVRTVAPAREGRANETVRGLVAHAFGLPPRDVELLSGAASRRKDFLLTALTLEQARRHLARALGEEVP